MQLIALFEAGEEVRSDAFEVAGAGEGGGVEDGVGEGDGVGFPERRGGDGVLADAHGGEHGDERAKRNGGGFVAFEEFEDGEAVGFGHVGVKDCEERAFGVFVFGCFCKGVDILGTLLAKKKFKMRQTRDVHV